ncbi:hypothetical protein M426DRAFT_10709 [Hypoxylon sp. CI-4A]|nr:hypothetical protein M426DRAFT_10709 [Hypoxylon sp. CI-4A]
MSTTVLVPMNTNRADILTIDRPKEIQVTNLIAPEIQNGIEVVKWILIDEIRVEIVILDSRGVEARAFPLQIDTTMADASRRSSVSTAQPVSSVPSAAPTEPAAERARGPSNTTTSTPILTVPKIKDPKLQGIFEAAYKLSDTSQERTILKLRKADFQLEDERRQQEINKAGSKVAGYAPLSEFQRRFEESRKVKREKLSSRSAELDRRFLEGLERFISFITSNQSNDRQAIAQGASSSALETRIAGLEKQNLDQQKLLSEAQTQIQTLIKDQQKSSKAFTTLEENFTGLRYDHNGLKSDHDGLKSNHDGLKADYDGLKSDYDGLESQQSVLQSENSELKRQIAELGCAKQSQDDALSHLSQKLQSLSQELQSFTVRMDRVENKVSAFMEKVEDLDMETYNEILETWIDHDFKTKVISHETAIETLRRDHESLQQSRASSEQQPSGEVQPAQQGQQAQQTPVDDKLNLFHDQILKMLEESTDACAEMVDDVANRVDKVESTVGALRQPETMVQNLNHRVGKIEDLNPQVQDLSTRFGELQQKLQSIQESSNSKETRDSDAVLDAMKTDVMNVKGSIEAIWISIKSLSEAWSNLSSKQMAEKILQQLDPYGQRYEKRFSKMETDFAQLKEKVNVHLSPDKSLADIKKAAPMDGKRRASPGSLIDDPIKKRKLALATE